MATLQGIPRSYVGSFLTLIDRLSPVVDFCSYHGVQIHSRKPIMVVCLTFDVGWA